MKAPFSGAAARFGFFCCYLLILVAPYRLGFAGSATWNLNPSSDDWHAAANWTPATVPDNEEDTATFGVSHQKEITLFNFVVLDGINFEPGASPYTIRAGSDGDTLYLFGAGVINNSGVLQTFDFGDTVSYIAFSNGFGANTAGINTRYINHAGATIGFSYSATADHAAFINNGRVEFGDTSTAADSTIISNAGSSVYFFYKASTGNATLLGRGGGANSGAVITLDDDVTGNPRIMLQGNATLDISFHAKPAATAGSIEGSGIVKLGTAEVGGGRQLTVGSNNLNTLWSGTIMDDGLHGSLVKVGRGSLNLAGPASYGGVTLLSSGELLVNNSSGSATGTSNVRVANGILGGGGIIGGSVIVGTEDRPGAVLSPGSRPIRIGTLTILGTVLFHPQAAFDCGFDSDAGSADAFVSNSVTIDDDALFSATDVGTTVLDTGTAFTVINNVGASPISGAFSNLADGSTITIGNNNFQANYEGGDGNDLTLTVIP